MTTFTGTTANDTLTGTSGDDFFNVYQGGDDTVSGLAGNDIFNFAAALTAADTVNGGTGSDTVEINGNYSAGLVLAATTLTSVEQLKLGGGNSYSITTNDANIAAGATLTINAANLTSGHILILDTSAETDGYYRVDGGADNDRVTVGATMNATDRIDGGSGNDVVLMDGDYSFGFTTQTFRNVSDLVLADGHNYHFVTNQQTVAPGAQMIIDGSEVGAGHSVVFSGAAETDGGSFYFDGGAGLMELAGGAGSDTFFMGPNLAITDRLNGNGGSDTVDLGGANYDLTLQHATLTSIENLKLGAGFNYNLTLGGAIAANATMAIDASAVASGNTVIIDAHKETAGSINFQGGAATATVTGGTGNDTFQMGADLTAADSLNGGAGTDTVTLGGANYNLALTATTLTGVENLALSDGYSYAFTTNDATIAAGATLAVNAAALTAGHALTLDASAETDGNLRVTGGAGDDSVTVGQGFNANDRFDGGAGNNTLSVAGDFSFGFTSATLRNIDDFVMAGGHSYHFTTNDANVAAGASLTVDASALGAGSTLVFSGTNETDGSFTFLGGAGLMEITGGANSDTFAMGANLAATDRLNGGAGSDTLTLGGANYDLVLQHATLTGIENITLGAGFNYNLTLGGSIATNATQTIDASALGAGNTVTIDAHNEVAGRVHFDGGAATTTLIGGQFDDIFNFALSSQGGFNAGDTIDGQGGTDEINFDGDYTGANTITLTGSQVQNVEEFDFAPGHSYQVTIAAGTLTGVSGFYADGSQIGAGNSLTFNGSAAMAAVELAGGAGNDSLQGGSGNDKFDLGFGGNDTATGNAGDDTFYMGAALTTGDVLNGGAGNDTVVLGNVLEAGTTISTTIVSGEFNSIETLKLNANVDYQINFAATNAALTIDATQLGVNDSLNFETEFSANNTFLIVGGAGNDVLSVTDQTQATIDLSEGGEDTATSFGTAGIFELGAALDAGDRLTGDGTSTALYLDGDYSGANALVIGDSTISSMGTIVLAAGNDYDITFTGTSAPTQTLDASALGAGDGLTADFSAVTYFPFSSFEIIGGAGNDVITGAPKGTIDLSHGGEDTANLEGGAALMGAALDAGDALSNVKTLDLDGDYTGANALDLTTANVSGSPAAMLEANHTYDITVSSAQVMSSLTTGGHTTIDFDGSAETANGFTFTLQSTDTGTITGGGGNDALTFGGSATSLALTFHGGGGDDAITTAATDLSAAHIDGGAGNDTVTLDSFNQTVTFGNNTLSNVETLILEDGGYVKLGDGNVAAGQTLTVESNWSLEFDGSAETDGHYNMILENPLQNSVNVNGGQLSDTINLTTNGLALGGSVFGNGGGDTIILGSADHSYALSYHAVSDSVGANYDTIEGLHLGRDIFVFQSFNETPTKIASAITSGTLSTATFDSDLTAALAAHLPAHSAELFTPNAGTLAGHTFLVLDCNGTAGYQAGHDMVWDITGYTGTLATYEFGENF